MENIKSIVKKIHQKIIQENYTIDTIEQMCSLIGISKKTFYKEYSSKEQFILDLLSLFNEETANELEKLIENENVLIIKVIQTFQTLVYKTYQRNKIQECYKKRSQLSEYLEEEFEIIFTNTVTKLLEKLNHKECLNPETNCYLFSKILVKFFINATLCNKEHININTKLLIKYLLINALKGVCIVSEHQIIDNYLIELDKVKMNKF